MEVCTCNPRIDCRMLPTTFNYLSRLLSKRTLQNSNGQVCLCNMKSPSCTPVFYPSHEIFVISADLPQRGSSEEVVWDGHHQLCIPTVPHWSSLRLQSGQHHREVSLKTDTTNCVFQLSHIGRVYVFRAVSTTERWDLRQTPPTVYSNCPTLVESMSSERSAPQRGESWDRHH